MKATGIVRKVDQLGRIVLPKELRKTLNIKENQTGLEIFVEGQDIILRKYEAACVFCGEASELVNYKGKNICKKCLEELKENR
ncbi:AbrB/MazE/SpoVT family DNA-binding domain-containing protein [Clostridium ganghwense]|uniref:AbrB/MazE/SpoVT family DNA-binding domain-containing protein n=1 Tax=Clostridium ganghwense TaxID=312089 RepID=A0ABT4CTN1_9CLOT|nr:AbrB/MazE/SpoVT family DNA-binding domain-containing protein [Clostridium ganghwense]MCY6372428.1 AbrB/MazE/SpoVT family DNA-binding domain-containing protein [Clostridium ganghwense]